MDSIDYVIISLMILLIYSLLAEIKILKVALGMLFVFISLYPYIREFFL